MSGDLERLPDLELRGIDVVVLGELGRQRALVVVLERDLLGVLALRDRVRALGGNRRRGRSDCHALTISHLRADDHDPTDLRRGFRSTCERAEPDHVRSLDGRQLLVLLVLRLDHRVGLGELRVACGEVVGDQDAHEEQESETDDQNQLVLARHD